jgi:hypothetical protein
MVMHSARSIDTASVLVGKNGPLGLSPLGKGLRTVPRLVPRAEARSSASPPPLSKDVLAAVVPAMCLAWLGLPVLGARAAPATPPGQAPRSASVLDRVAMGRGSHDALYGEVMEYYLDMNRPDRSRGADSAAKPRSGAGKPVKVAVATKGRGVRSVQPVAEMKRDAVFDKAAVKKGKVQKAIVDHKQHLASDEAFIKAEMKSALAFGVVCVGAFLFWRLRAGDSLAKEAWGGIDKDFVPIREADTGETEEQKEFARMEAARAIERAKRKEREYAERRQVGTVIDVDMQWQQERVEPAMMTMATDETGVTYQTDGDTLQTEEVGMADAVGTADAVGMADVSGTAKLGSPGLLAMAVFSVMVDDIRKELNNMPKHVLPAGRVMVCGQVNGAGKSMAAWTPRIKTHPSKMPSGSSAEVTAKPTALGGKDLLLAPVAAAFKEISGKRVAPLISDKYNPMYDLHKYVNTPESDKPRHPRTDRDPFFALLSALQSFDGPVASERLAKYDPLSNLAKIPVEREDADEYSLLHALIRAAPEQGEVDVEKLFPILGDIMAKLRKISRAQIVASAGVEDGKSTSADEVAEAERRADEAEMKAMALLERIERKEDELLGKVQQLKTRLTESN